MKVYKTTNGIVLQKNNKYHLLADEYWDELINDDALYQKLEGMANKIPASEHGAELVKDNLQAPIGNQELWACGVTYLRSKIGRQEESKTSGGADFYGKVYEAARPEVFFKSTAHRIVGPGAKVRIRKDSSWDVPEPELTLMVSSSGKIVGYTIGNDMSSRSIEGENPLYLPQAKTYDGCASIGPCIYVTEQPLDMNTQITLDIHRGRMGVFSGCVALKQMKRSLEELVSFVYRECSFPNGSLIMTGTGIVPGNDFTLRSGDMIKITIGPIGELINTVG